MGRETPIPLHVAVIGGGPAGVSACLELSKHKELKVGLFESESEIGGMPRSCHIFFGMRDMKRIYTGPAYARKLQSLVRSTSVSTHTNATVLKIIPGRLGESHRLTVSSPEGLREYESRFVLLAMGCYEKSREARRMPGARSAGVFTTGSLQQIVNIQHLKPGKRAVVMGSEHVAFSSVLTLKRAGLSIAGLVDEDEVLKTYPIPARGMSYLFGFPIYRGYRVNSIFGKNRVEGVELVSIKDKRTLELECDTFVCTGGFRPDASLIFNTSIEEDPSTLGPIVDLNFKTSVPNILAAGNILHGADMHDLCALEGKKAADTILKGWLDSGEEKGESVRIRAEYPIRYVVPQILPLNQIKKNRASAFIPGVSFQVTYTMKKTTVEAWSGEEKIWDGSHSRLIANSRIPVPVEKFDWSRVNPKESIILKIRGL